MQFLALIRLPISTGAMSVRTHSTQAMSNVIDNNLVGAVLSAAMVLNDAYARPQRR